MKRFGSVVLLLACLFTTSSYAQKPDRIARSVTNGGHYQLFQGEFGLVSDKGFTIAVIMRIDSDNGKTWLYTTQLGPNHNETGWLVIDEFVPVAPVH